MFQTASGVTIPFPDKILEGYQVTDNGFLINLSFKKLRSFVDDFIDGLVEPLRFVLEIPLKKDEEDELRKSNTDPFHKKICSLDWQSKAQIVDLMNNYGELLLNDGMSNFAIYSREPNDGIFVQKYKIISIFSQNPAKFIDFLDKYDLCETERLVTVWETFTHETPGETRAVTIDGIGIYNLYDKLVKLGMYIVKVAED